PPPGLEEALAPFVAELQAVVTFAKSLGSMVRDPDAEALWAEVYGPLSEGARGLTGAVISRAEAQGIRLSVLYALLDRAPEIGVAQLEAALAVWDYADASARCIFGRDAPEPMHERIIDACRLQGRITRTDIHRLFARHLTADQLDHVLADLEEAGRLVKRPVP